MDSTLSFLLQKNSCHKILLSGAVVAFKNVFFCLLFFKNDKWV